MYFVFVKKNCGVCKSVVNQLKQRNVSFQEIDVGTAAGLEKARKLNIDSAGTIIDENNNIIPLTQVK